MMIYRLRATMRRSQSDPKFVNQCGAVLDKMEACTSLTSPPVVYAVAKDHLKDLIVAVKATHGGGAPGATATRRTKRSVVDSDMNLMIAYVESEANAHFETGVALIEGVGLMVVKATATPKAELAARYTGISGEADLDAKARKGRRAYRWQMSTNLTTWTSLPDTVVASTHVTGLTPVTMYYFRFCTLGVDGTSDWSAPISFIAH
jgi:hypothetical protein